MKITAVRHGQTTGNLSRIVESRLGGQLTQTGIDQAVSLAEKLKNEHFGAIYCSTLQRCIDTASYIRKYHVDTPFSTYDELRELDKGTYNGGPWSDLPEYIHTETYINQAFPDGESWMDMAKRIGPLLDMIYQEGHQHILIVAHDGTLKVMQSLLENVPLAIAIQTTYENATAYIWEMDQPLPQVAE